MILTLTTHDQTDDYTQSILRVGTTEFHAIERPWIHTPEHRGGKSFESCVPGGRYQMVPHDSHRFGKTWALVNPELDVYHLPDDRPGGVGRYAILLHRANRPADLAGCVGLGTSAAPGQVLFSKKAMKILRDILPWEEHTLDIIRHPNHHGTAL